jgi:hypothetical protein
MPVHDLPLGVDLGEDARRIMADDVPLIGFYSSIQVFDLRDDIGQIFLGSTSDLLILVEASAEELHQVIHAALWPELAFLDDLIIAMSQ